MPRSGRIAMETDTATMHRDIAVTSSRTTRPNGPMTTVTVMETIQTPVRVYTVPLDTTEVAVPDLDEDGFADEDEVCPGEYGTSPYWS